MLPECMPAASPGEGRRSPSQQLLPPGCCLPGGENPSAGETHNQRQGFSTSAITGIIANTAALAETGKAKSWRLGVHGDYALLPRNPQG